MISPGRGQLELNQVVEVMNEFYENNKKYDSGFEITIGTDSQNFSDTKVVRVVAMRCIGHGGIYFYDISHVDKIRDVRTKLYYETEISLQLANQLLEEIEKNEKYTELYSNSFFVIHVDAGKSDIGKTKELIPGIIGWIKASGYNCQVKPDSYAASSIADKISK